MPNHESAKKRVRQNIRRATINGANRSRYRTFISKLEVVLRGDGVVPEVAREAFRVTQSEIHRAVSKGVLHRNAAARKLSRLSTRVRALSEKAQNS